MKMSIVEYFNKLDTQNTSTEFSKDIKDYRLLNEPMSLDNEFVGAEQYAEYYEYYKNKDLYVVTVDREILGNNWYYWLGDLIIDKDNKIIDGICFN